MAVGYLVALPEIAYIHSRNRGFLPSLWGFYASLFRDLHADQGCCRGACRSVGLYWSGLWNRLVGVGPHRSLRRTIAARTPPHTAKPSATQRHRRNGRHRLCRPGNWCRLRTTQEREAIAQHVLVDSRRGNHRSASNLDPGYNPLRHNPSTTYLLTPSLVATWRRVPHSISPLFGETVWGF